MWGLRGSVKARMPIPVDLLRLPMANHGTIPYVVMICQQHIVLFSARSNLISAENPKRHEGCGLTSSQHLIHPTHSLPYRNHG